MDAQAFKQKIYTEYMNSDGMVMVKNRLHASPQDQQIGMGNGLLHTGLFFTILAELGALTQTDQDWLENVIRICTVKVWGQPVHGLIHRSPAKFTDQQSQDDYFGLLAAAYHAKNRFATDVFEYGKKSNWHWDNLRPEGRPSEGSYFDRFPGFLSYVRMCAQDKLGVYELLPLIGAIASTTFSEKGNSDSRIHRWCQITVFRKERPALGGLVGDLYRWNTKRQYGSIAQSFAGYFGPTGDLPHPFTLVEGLR